MNTKQKKMKSIYKKGKKDDNENEEECKKGKSPQIDLEPDLRETVIYKSGPFYIDLEGDEERIYESIDEISFPYIEYKDFSDELYELYAEDIDEIKYCEIEILNEVLSKAQRIKKKNTMRRFKNKIKIARKRSMKKRGSLKTTKKRARKQAINTLKKKFSGGKSLKNMSFGEKQRVERMVGRRKKVVDKMSRRMIRVVRKNERSRLANK